MSRLGITNGASLFSFLLNLFVDVAHSCCYLNESSFSIEICNCQSFRERVAFCYLLNTGNDGIVYIDLDILSFGADHKRRNAIKLLSHLKAVGFLQLE